MLTFLDLERTGRARLAKEGIPVPKEAKPAFYAYPQKAPFVRIVYSTGGIGDRFWYVNFSDVGFIEEFGTDIKQG